MAKTINRNRLRKNGNEYYNFLRQTLIPGEPISDKPNYFERWIHNEDLQFSIPNNNDPQKPYFKAIPRHIIIGERNAFLVGLPINNAWLKRNGCNRGWCLADALNGLFQWYP